MKMFLWRTCVNDCPSAGFSFLESRTRASCINLSLSLSLSLSAFPLHLPIPLFAHPWNIASLEQHNYLGISVYKWIFLTRSLICDTHNYNSIIEVYLNFKIICILILILPLVFFSTFTFRLALIFICINIGSYIFTKKISCFCTDGKISVRIDLPLFSTVVDRKSVV